VVIAEELRSNEIAVEFQPTNNVHSLGRFGAVVLGAPLYMGRLHKDGRRFLTAHRNPLSKVPVALFVLGPVQKIEKDSTGARQQLEKELVRFP
jgi:menaquinone-dependent protoporphyrinogen oxidase